MPAPGPLASPTPNTGAHAQGALMAAQMLEIGKKAAALLDPTSPLGQAVLKALQSIGKHVGSAPPETQVNSLMSQLVEAKRNAMQRLALQQMQHQGGPNPAAAAQGAVPGQAPPAAGAAPTSPMTMAA